MVLAHQCGECQEVLKLLGGACAGERVVSGAAVHAPGHLPQPVRRCQEAAVRAAGRRHLSGVLYFISSYCYPHFLGHIAWSLMCLVC